MVFARSEGLRDDPGGRPFRELAGSLDRPLSSLGIPTTLHASLMARLDRLGPAAKEVAQIGAVLGREFAYELIEPVATRPTGELQAALGQLGDAGLLFYRGAVRMPPTCSSMR